MCRKYINICRNIVKIRIQASQFICQWCGNLCENIIWENLFKLQQFGKMDGFQYFKADELENGQRVFDGKYYIQKTGCPGKNQKSKRITSRSKQLKTNNRWTVQQNQVYMQFLRQNAHILRYKSIRRSHQIFNILEERMEGRRTAIQCKSHHQKMKKAANKGTIKQIINYIKHKNIQRKQVQQKTKESNRLESVQVVQNNPSYFMTASQQHKSLKIHINLQANFLFQW